MLYEELFNNRKSKIHKEKIMKINLVDCHNTLRKCITLLNCQYFKIFTHPN